MSAESYPPTDKSHLFRRVSNEEASNIRRDWTGNDESKRNHNGHVPLSESPLRLRLSWKKSPNDSARLVGIFDLDLKQLLRGGYIRYDADSESEVRLRFYHDWDNLIYIEAKSNEPRLPLGRVP